MGLLITSILNVIYRGDAYKNLINESILTPSITRDPYVIAICNIYI